MRIIISGGNGWNNDRIRRNYDLHHNNDDNNRPRRDGTPLSRFLWYFLLGLGLIIFCTVSYFIIGAESDEWEKEKRNYGEVAGIVVEKESWWSSTDDAYRYSYVFEYIVDDVAYTAEQRNSGTDYNRGQSKLIYYRLDNPSDYKIDPMFKMKGFGLKILMIVLIGVGVLMCIIGISRYVKEKKEFGDEGYSAISNDSKGSESTSALSQACPYCNAKNSTNASHCGQCGAKLK